jgi:hypothetical protein
LGLKTGRINPISSYKMLNKDVVSIIAEYLPMDDILKMDNKINWQPIAYARVMAKLNEIFGAKTTDFVRALQESNAVISGSFVLQALLNENWQDSDIDIYIKVIREYDAKLRDEKRYNGKNFCAIENWCWFENKCDEKTHEYEQYPHLSGVDIDVLSKYNVNGISIQIMKCSTELLDINDFIDKTFDHGFCKVTFDGKQVFILDQTSLRDRTSSYVQNQGKCNENIVVLGQRYNYTGKDFTPGTNECLAMHYRAIKYINRGFTIIGYQAPSKILYTCDHIGRLDYYLNGFQYKLKFGKRKRDDDNDPRSSKRPKIDVRDIALKPVVDLSRHKYESIGPKYVFGEKTFAEYREPWPQMDQE